MCENIYIPSETDESYDVQQLGRVCVCVCVCVCACICVSGHSKFFLVLCRIPLCTERVKFVYLAARRLQKSGGQARCLGERLSHRLNLGCHDDLAVRDGEDVERGQAWIETDQLRFQLGAGCNGNVDVQLPVIVMGCFHLQEHAQVRKFRNLHREPRQGDLGFGTLQIFRHRGEARREDGQTGLDNPCLRIIVCVDGDGGVPDHAA